MFIANLERIKMGIEGLNQFNSTPEYGTTRVLFTEPELKSREFIKCLMAENELEIYEDSIGNIFGTLKGSEPELPPVWTGSHIDTVLNAGMFDGMAGVIAGIEALKMIKESKIPHKRNISAVVYTSEEPTRFGLSCLGSRAMAGKLDLESTKSLTDEQGKTLYEVLDNLGYDLEKFKNVKKEKGKVFAAVELHIEQSSSLEKENKTIGVVKSICAPANYEVVVKGIQSHAGGTSMKDRVDAFTATCEIALEIEKLARASTGEYVTATVARISVVPGAVNVISGLVQFSIDVRYTEMESLTEIMDKVKIKISEIKKNRGVEIEIQELNKDIPTQCNTEIISILNTNCDKYDYSHKSCISGAYHDSLMVALFTPVAMIFVPSKNGISHSPTEWTDYEDLVKGTNILAETLLSIANKEVLE